MADGKWLFIILPILTPLQQYWVTFSFLTVFESLVNAVYWFPFYYTFKFIFTLWLALPQFGSVSRLSTCHKTDYTSGAQLVFRSFIEPVFARYFSTSKSTAANLRAKVDAATDKTL
jgi:receptor expression-enhancing protein 5/6